MKRHVLTVVLGAILLNLPADAQTLPVSIPGDDREHSAAGRNPAEPFVLQFDHTNILVSDLEESADFYKNILHLKELETPWGANPSVRFFAIGNNQQIHVVQIAGEFSYPSKVVHMAFTVQDFDAYLEFLRDEGIEYANFAGDSTEPQLRPDGVKQIYFQDPDGNWIEVNDARY
jgi:lactoylglutathione lyase